MTAAVMSRKSSRSAWLVIGLTTIALLIGWGLKTSTEGRTKAVSTGAVSAAVPAQWLVEMARDTPLGSRIDPTRVFTSWNPLDPATRYAVSLLPAGDGQDLAALASLRNLQRAQSLSAYRVIEQTPVALKGRDGYKVVFAFVDSSAMNKVPVVFEGVDYYFTEADQVIVVTLETSQDFKSAVVKFQDFAAGVDLGE